MPGISVVHLLLIAGILLLFFGPSRLPQVGSSIGKAIRSFKDGLSEFGNQTSDSSEKKADSFQVSSHQQETNHQLKNSNREV